MAEQKKIPEHQAVYERLREMILLGRFAPGEPLTIMGLTEVLGVGMTPVREAIRRLAAESALLALGNRRVVVPAPSADQIRDIYFIRLSVEPELTRRAVKSVTGQQIRDLREIDDAINDALEAGDLETYLERNNRFHFQIYALAKTPVLYAIAKTLWVQMGPSLRVVCGRYGTANLPDKHSELLTALSARDPEAAAHAMRDDLEQSLYLTTSADGSKFDQKMPERG